MRNGKRKELKSNCSRPFGNSAIQIVLTLINLTTLPMMLLEPLMEPKITKRDIALIGTVLMLIGGLMPQVLNSKLWM